MEAMHLGVQTHLDPSVSPTDIGPVTLTADPAVFQRELRELFVQVGCPAPAAGPLGRSSQSLPEARIFAPPETKVVASCHCQYCCPALPVACTPAGGPGDSVLPGVASFIQ